MINNISRKIIYFIVLFTFSVYAQERVKIMTYNLLQYPNNSANRNEYFQTVVSTVNPDILVVQEMGTNAGFNLFASQVLDGTYSAGDFNENDNLNNAIYFKTDSFDFLSNIPIPTNLRDINQFSLVHKITADTILIYSAHLKSSQGSDNELSRLSQINSLREVTDELHSNRYFIVVGDFNVYSSNEPAYQRLLDRSSSGYFLDPLNAPGEWHENVNFSYLHTQSSRLPNIGDGGASGGLDDRFDMILISQSIADYGGINYIDGTYKAIGNDAAHFNRSINELPNNAVSASVANALFYASDHLPVAAEFYFGVTSSSDEIIEPAGIELSQNFPNPFNPSTTIEYNIPGVGDENFRSLQPVKLIVYDILGREVASLVNEQQKKGKYKVVFEANNLTSGIYFYSLITPAKIITRKMILLR